MKTKNPLRLSILALSLATLGSTLHDASAAVVVPSAYTSTGYDMTSITINGTVYSTSNSTLFGSTASIIPLPATTLSYYVDGTLPALGANSVNAAASGLNFRDGAANIDIGSTFQFGQTIGASDRIFLGDLGVGDPISLNLINSSGAVIGDYSLSLTAANFGVLISNTLYRLINNATGANSGTGTYTQSFTSFQISDFTGTTGDLSTATGIRLSSGSNIFDPSMVGLATAVPEPATCLLLAGALTATVVFRRRLKTTAR